MIDPNIGPAFVTSLAGLVASVALLAQAVPRLRRVEQKTERVEQLVNGASQDAARQLAVTRERLDAANSRLARQDTIISALAARLEKEAP